MIMRMGNKKGARTFFQGSGVVESWNRGIVKSLNRETLNRWGIVTVTVRLPIHDSRFTIPRFPDSPSLRRRHVPFAAQPVCNQSHGLGVEDFVLTECGHAIVFFSVKALVGRICQDS